MTRRLALAWVGLVLAATATSAQVPFSRELMPARTSLARIGLERHWYNVVPLRGSERVLELSIDDNLVFVQTNMANFHAFDSESGRRLWSANFGYNSVEAQPASANSTTVFVTNSNVVYAIDRASGRTIWTYQLSEIPSGSTSANEDHVWVGLGSGTLLSLNAKTGKVQWNVQTRGELTSRPHPSGRVIAFASQEGKVYASRTEYLQVLWRWNAGGQIVAPLGAHGVRTLLIPSLDKNLYAVDLFLGDTKWVFPTGAPIRQEPLVAGDDIYVVNAAGMLHSLNALSGTPNWSIDTLGGPLLGLSPKRVYLESRDGDLFIVDRLTGQMLFDPRATHERAGVNLREFHLGPTNRLNDRVYIASTSGMLICLREAGAVKPVTLRDPKEKPFGYIPPEGYPDTPAIPAAPPIQSDKTDEGVIAAPAAESRDATIPAPAPPK